MKELPRYKHDCEDCIFLGHFEEYDLYYCPDDNPVLTTVIARYGDIGDQYMSGLSSSCSPLMEAKGRARKRGFVF